MESPELERLSGGTRQILMNIEQSWKLSAWANSLGPSNDGEHEDDRGACGEIFLPNIRILIATEEVQLM